MSEEEPPGAGKELDELSAMGAAAVRKREKWKWLLPSTSSAQTTTSGTLKETFRAGDIRLSPYLASSARPPRWNSRSFTCLLAIAFLIQCVSALPPVIRIGTKNGNSKRFNSNAISFSSFSCAFKIDTIGRSKRSVSINQYRNGY